MNNLIEKRGVLGERVMLMIPFNVVMTAKISGTFDHTMLRPALNKLKVRHSLLSVRLLIDEDNTAWYTSENVPDFTVEIIERDSDVQWQNIVKRELKSDFDLTRGPLIRFAVVQGVKQSELVVCCHHMISDGISLTWLIQDILTCIAYPEKEVEILPEPPLINSETVQSPPRINAAARGVMKLINNSWRKKNIQLTLEDRKSLYNRFWEEKNICGITSFELSCKETAALVLKTREEGVTVNSALWTAFLAAQDAVQDSGELFRSRSGMAVSTRDKMVLKAGKALGFFASSLKATLKYDSKKTFWDMTRKFQKIIKKEMKRTNPFQMILTELIDPGLFDSLYFEKYKLINNNLSRKFLQKMAWDSINFGYAITNVGAVPVDSSYGEMKLDSVYGPVIYSDVNEKTIGVVTVSEKITFTVSYNENHLSKETIGSLKEKFIYFLKKGISES